MTHSFTVDRATWLRGEGPIESTLQRPSDGKRCCLGFLALSCGIPADAIQDRKTLLALKVEYWDRLPPKLNEKAAAYEHEIVERLMALNDDPGPFTGTAPLVTSEEDREAKLTATFLEADIGVTFTDPENEPFTVERVNELLDAAQPGVQYLAARLDGRRPPTEQG